MKIFIVVEDDFSKTVWGKAILDGMKHRASELRHEICEMKDFDIDFEGQKKVAILVGTANSWINKTLCELWDHSICGIVLNCQPTEIVPETSYILIDYACATYECIQYLHACDKKRIALFAINPNSITGTTKHKSFIEYGLSEKDVYISDDSLTGCYARLKARISDYDAVSSIETDFFSDKYLPELAYYKALAKHKTGDSAEAKKILDAFEEKINDGLSHTDSGYFAAYAMLISYPESGAEARKNHYTRLSDFCRRAREVIG